MNTTEESIKSFLLKTDLFIENEYFQEYVKLLSNNVLLKPIKFKTEAHHAIPKFFFKMNNLEIDNSKENIFNLYHKDHLLAHYYLSFCCASDRYKYKAIAAVFIAVRKFNIEHLENVLDILDKYQNLKEEYRRLCSIFMKGENNPFYGKHFSDEQKKHISQIRIEKGIAKGENNPRYGKPVSKETREKIGNANRGRKFSAETIEKLKRAHGGTKNPMFGRKKEKNKIYGKKWYTNGKETKRFYENEQPIGWKLGRHNFIAEGKNNSAYGRKWIYNPKTKDRKYVKKEELEKYLLNGYIEKFVRNDEM